MIKSETEGGGLSGGEFIQGWHLLFRPPVQQL